jgi:signal transduction histidine kinase
MIRRAFQRKPIAAKLRTLITAACLVAVVLTCLALAVGEWIAGRAEAINVLNARASIISANVSAAVLFNSPRDADVVLAGLRADPNSRGGAIFRPDGSLFVQSLPPGALPLPPPPASGAVHEFSAEGVVVWVSMRAADGRKLGTIAVRMSLATLYARLRLYAVSSLGVMLAATLFSYWLSNRLQQLISQPLLSLAAAADRVTQEKDFSVRTARIADDEIGRLASAFNTMLATIQAGQDESARLYAQVRSYATGLEARVNERTQQLQNAYRELESFSYSVSHDLRAPLRHIASYAEILQEEAGNKLPPETAELARRIVRAVERLEKLINALLDFARVTQKEPTLETVDIASLAREVAAELLVENAGDAIVDVQPIAPCQADPVLLRQVLANLLGNALKYSRGRRPPRISVREVPARDPGFVACAVQDNGVGFDPAGADKLFNVFVRLHHSQEFEGTGIGLATVKRIVQRHGGNIWAESARDAGATFYFTLPRAVPAAAATPPERTASPSRRGAAVSTRH